MTLEEIKQALDKLAENMKTVVESLCVLMEKGGPGSGRRPEGESSDDDEPEGGWDSDKTDEDGSNETSDSVPEYDEDSSEDEEEKKKS
jgi:hypothetical protein